MTPIFRHATQQDVPHVVELVESAYRGPSSRSGWTTEADLLEGQRINEQMLAETLGDPATVVLLAHDGDELVGCCELRHDPTRVAAHLGMFAVRPGLQGGGVGRAVLAEAERLAGEWGAECLELSVIEVRDELISWYRRRGYEPTGAAEPFPYGDERFGRPLRDDLRFVVLSKQLHADVGRDAALG